MVNKISLLFLLIFLWSFAAAVVLAQEFSSTNFTDSNPVITFGGGKSTSTNFQLIGGAGQEIIGESSSSAFIGRAGFFYFPFVSTPVVSAAAGDTQVSLSWTSAAGALGLNVSGYAIGQSTNSGGPYSFVGVGNTLSGSAVGLTNGATYYFVVRALDFFGDPIVTSTEVSAAPAAAPTPPAAAPPSGGTALPVSQTRIIFSGRAYPNSAVTLLKDAQIAATVIAGADASFQITISDISGGNYIFSIYGEDSKGIRSSLLTFPIKTIFGVTTQVSGILVPPSISVDKSEVKRGDSIIISGQSVPGAEITIAVNSEKDFFAKTIVDKNGNYSYKFDTELLSMGRHYAKSKAAFDGEVSIFGREIDFLVGVKNIFEEPTPKCPVKTDLNNDCRVNLIDISILIFWFDKSATPPKVDFDGNGRVDLVDLSIMAYFWTG